MWDKLEDFLFDIVGLLFPGIVALLTYGFTASFFLNWAPVKSYLTDHEFEKVTFMKFLDFVGIDNFQNYGGQQYIYLLIIFLMLGYLLGHIAKVFSKLFYSFMEIIFDNFLNKPLLSISEKL